MENEDWIAETEREHMAQSRASLPELADLLNSLQQLAGDSEAAQSMSRAPAANIYAHSFNDAFLGQMQYSIGTSSGYTSQHINTPHYSNLNNHTSMRPLNMHELTEAANMINELRGMVVEVQRELEEVKQRLNTAEQNSCTESYRRIAVH